MSHTSGHAASPGSPLLELLTRKVGSLEAMMAELCAHKLPSLADKVDGVRELLAARRKDHYLVEEIAALTGRSAYTVRRWITQKKLHAVRLRDGGPHGRLLIARAELERLIAEGKGADVPTAALD